MSASAETRRSCANIVGMNRTDFLDALSRDGLAFGAACDIAGLPAPVESCPGWSVADLLWHLSEVHHFWRTVVVERLEHWNEYTRPPRPADADLLAFYRSGLHATVEVLTDADPSTAIWTWSADKTVGFVIRRMAQETAVHRWDAEKAAGHTIAIESLLASDGIDEFLTHFIGDVREGADPVGGSVHIHCTDVAGEWTLLPNETGFDVTREHAKGDCALRGTASDLLLALWRRTPSSTLDLVGDPAMAQRFIARTALE
ncbi:MAG: hypothetical protein RLZZ623_1823 [Actinomycetota bacterium]